MIRRCRFARSRTFSEYSRLFRWLHRKIAKGTSLAVLVVIPVTLSFIPSDLRTVDPTNHIQALHDPPLRYNIKQAEIPVVYFKSLTSLLYSVNHNKLTASLDMKIAALRNVTSYSLDIDRHSRGLQILDNLKMEATCLSATLVNSLQATRRHTTEGGNLHSHRFDSLEQRCVHIVSPTVCR
jgi:hypothetical protein